LGQDAGRHDEGLRENRDVSSRFSGRNRRSNALRLLRSSDPADSQVVARGRMLSLDMSSPGLEFLARAGFIAAALYTFNTGLKIYQGSGIWGPSVPAGLFLYVLAASLLVVAFVLHDPGRFRVQLLMGAAILVTIVLSVSYEIDFGNPTYGTDSMAFAHTAGEVLMEGHNPYQVVGDTVAGVVDQYHLSDSVVTRTTAGTPVERLVSYPGGHVLMFTGAVALGVDDLRWVTLAFEVGALILIWTLVSPVGRLFIPFALLMDSNLTVFFTSGAVTDWLWVLPLVVAGFYLNRERFGYAGLALGVACAMKQQPWFLVPFAVVWVYQTLKRRADTSERRDGLIAFLAGTASGFLILNIPFMVWSFNDWVQGILHPALGGLVPDGQGFALLASRGLLPIPGGWYSLALLLVTALTLWAYSKWFARMQDLLWVLPPALFLISQRSFHSYFIFWVPLALLWLDLRLNRPSPTEPVTEDSGFRSGTSRSFALAAIGIAVGLGAFALTTLGVRSVEVGEVTPLVEDGVIKSLQVDLTNLSDDVVKPVFEVYWRGQPLPWQPMGVSEVPAHESGTVEIRPTSAEGIPPTVLTATGSLEVAGFRVRVNESSRGVYSASDVIHIELNDLLVNPSMGSWSRETTIFAAPYGWRSAVHGGEDNERWIEPAERGAGAVLGVSSKGAGPGDWIEAALLQDVGRFAGCYTWDFSGNLPLVTDRGGSPLAVGGIQFVQGDTDLWFVASTGTDGQVTTLPDGTTMVHINEQPGERITAQLDLATAAQVAGIDPEQGGIVKVFNAVHETIAARSELVTYSLDDGCG
jgi:uncharacterized membrane protein